MRNRQSGVTFIGWIVLLAPMAVMVYVGIVITPIYLNYFRVSKAITEVGTDFKGSTGPIDKARFKEQLEKRFDVESIENPKPKDIELRRDGDGWAAEAAYDETVSLFGNVSLLISFDKKVTLN
ncbi:MAG: DUF4845 domain-containing protein [Steroidobacteraceae bacterium]|jgi:uncharacterized protein DUF4845